MEVLARSAVLLASAPVVAIALTGCVIERAVPRDAPTPVGIIVRPRTADAAYVYVRGEFALPGRYTMLAPARLTQVVDAAGGLTRIADERVIVSRRLDDGRLLRFVIPTEAVRSGEMQDPELVAEDTIDAIGRVE